MLNMHITYLDSNSWLIEMGEQRILLDPWLVGDLVFGNAAWFFRGYRSQSRSIPENIDLILLSQGLEDHAHPPTLKELNHDIPVVVSPNAAKVVDKLGYSQINSISHGESYTIANKIKITAFPGSPIGPTLVENGYLIQDLTNGTTLYYEPHGYHSPKLKDVAPVDVIITPIIDLQLPLLGAIIKGQSTALQAVEWLKPQVIMPTAAGGDIGFEGLLTSILSSKGGIEEFSTLLKQKNLSTKVFEPKPWERCQLDLALSTAR
jgi:L-ascorbate metabolism protein UlaG (beta-lactamase superfamily)